MEKIKKRLIFIDEILNKIKSEENSTLGKLTDFIFTGGESGKEIYYQKMRLLTEREELLRELEILNGVDKNEALLNKLNSMYKQKHINKNEYEEIKDALNNGFPIKKIEDMIGHFETKTIDEVNSKNEELVRFASVLIHYCLNLKEFYPKDILKFQQILQKEFAYPVDSDYFERYHKEVLEINIDAFLETFYNYFEEKDFDRIYNLIKNLYEQNNDSKFSTIRRAVYKLKKKKS